MKRQKPKKIPAAARPLGPQRAPGPLHSPPWTGSDPPRAPRRSVVDTQETDVDPDHNVNPNAGGAR